MRIKRILSIILAVILLLSMATYCLASGIYYLPDVTGEMSDPSYWTDETDVLMSFEEIERLNEETISEKGTTKLSG